MFEKLSTAAEQVATSLSRRNFLVRAGRAALIVAGVVGGILTLPTEAEAGGKYCCCGGRCLTGKACGRGCYRVRDCAHCL